MSPIAGFSAYDWLIKFQKPRRYRKIAVTAIDVDRLAHGKKPLSHQDNDKKPPTKEVKISPVDPDAGYMLRDGKPTGFFYLDHRTVDGVHSLITDTHVTPAHVHDSGPYLDRIDRMRTRFGFEIGAVGLDAGYFTPLICKGLVKHNICGVIGYRRPNHKGRFFYKREYEYDTKADVYRCPNGQLLAYSTTNRLGYRKYKSDAEQCSDCPSRAQCTASKNHIKVVTRHIWQHFKEQLNAN